MRDISFQRESLPKLDKLISECVSSKEAAIADKGEFDANAFLCFEMAAKALKAEFEFYISLKRDKVDEAWNFLVDAQSFAADAIKAHEFGSHLEPYARRLLLLERAFFPVPVFTSTGLLVKASECSICGKEYGECDHIKGRAYMGKLCVRIVKEAELREISVVTDPADKRCRALSFVDNGVTRNAFTHRVMNEGKTTSANTPQKDARH